MSGRKRPGGALWKSLVFVAVAGGTFGFLSSLSSCFHWDDYLSDCRDAGNCLPDGGRVDAGTDAGADGGADGGMDGGLLPDGGSCMQVGICYTGHPSTRNIGVCHDGLWRCEVDGGLECAGQQLPAGSETCLDGDDDDCDGFPDDGCAMTCIPLGGTCGDAGTLCCLPPPPSTTPVNCIEGFCRACLVTPSTCTPGTDYCCGNQEPCPGTGMCP